MIEVFSFKLVSLEIRLVMSEFTMLELELISYRFSLTSKS